MTWIFCNKNISMMQLIFSYQILLVDHYQIRVSLARFSMQRFLPRRGASHSRHSRSLVLPTMEAESIRRTNTGVLIFTPSKSARILNGLRIAYNLTLLFIYVYSPSEIMPCLSFLMAQCCCRRHHHSGISPHSHQYEQS